MLWHGGVGSAARVRFAAAPASERDALIKFLDSL
jgi:CxxC motif-containing protein (DUF1111 family)